MKCRNVLIMGAAGRDYHNFNTVFRDSERYNVVAFTATQIPNIADRRYPPEPAGKRYPQGIPIFPEAQLAALIERFKVDEVVFAYSDVSFAHVMERAATVLAAGAGFRMHHCIADGIALGQVLLAMTDTCPDPPAPAAKPAEPPVSRPLTELLRPVAAAVDTTLSVGDTLLREGAELLSHPEHALDLARLGVDGVAALGKLLLIRPDPQTIFKGQLGVAKRAAWSAPLPLQSVKALGHITGTTVNDVLLTAVTGALRRYLESRGQPAEGISIRAVVPVNLRPPDAPLTLGNRFGLVFVDLPINVADPFERLLAFKAQMAAIKDSPEAVVAFGILNAIGMTPVGVEQRVVEVFGKKATAVMTNVPGPRERLYLAGKPLRQIMFWVPQSGRLGLGVSILSYAGEVCVGIATDAGLVPNPEAIVAGFMAEFDELMDLVRLVEADGQAKEQRAGM
jgi:diacylglycerol O-acyltransferase / wax synthase